MVLWRLLFGNVSALVAQNGQNGMPNGISFSEDGPNDTQAKKRPNPSSSANTNGIANGQLADSEDGTDPVVEELNNVRSREITSKAVSGVLLMLLKWFKISRESLSNVSYQKFTEILDILKYEYLAQLLLDANYLPLILKLFAHQDVDRTVDQRNDREDLEYVNAVYSQSRT